MPARIASVRELSCKCVFHGSVESQRASPAVATQSRTPITNGARRFNTEKLASECKATGNSVINIMDNLNTLYWSDQYEDYAQAVGDISGDLPGEHGEQRGGDRRAIAGGGEPGVGRT